MPRQTLKVRRDNGLRLLLVGYESGNQQILHNIKKGMRVEVARRFTRDCHELGIIIHGTFILGLPGETRETIEETIRLAAEINPHTIQASLASCGRGRRRRRRRRHRPERSLRLGFPSPPAPEEVLRVRSPKHFFPHLPSQRAPVY